MNSGIYKITNIINNKFYYGSTNNFKERRADHFSELRNNKHKNSHLQNSFNKHKEKNFIFEVIENLSVEFLQTIEQVYLDKYWDDGVRCYNISKFADCPGRGENHFMFGKRGAEHHLFNKPVSEETRKKMSASWERNRETNIKRLSGKNSPRFGKTGVLHVQSKKVNCYDVDGTLIKSYGSTLEAFRETGINPKNIQSVANGLSNTRLLAGGFVWRYEGDNFELYPINKIGKTFSKKKRAVVQYDLSGVQIKEYESLSQAERETNIKTQHICSCCKNQQKTASGYIWKYKV